MVACAPVEGDKGVDAYATHGMALSVLHGILCTLAATAIMPGFLARFTADSWLFFGKETAGLPDRTGAPWWW